MEAPHASLTALGGGAGTKGEGTDLRVGRAAAELAKLRDPRLCCAGCRKCKLLAGQREIQSHHQHLVETYLSAKSLQPPWARRLALYPQAGDAGEENALFLAWQDLPPPRRRDDGGALAAHSGSGGLSYCSRWLAEL